MDRWFGRAYVIAACMPYFYSLFKIKGIMAKLGLGYMLYSCLDAFYDMGVYTNFYINGPHFMQAMMQEPED